MFGQDRTTALELQALRMELKALDREVSSLRADWKTEQLALEETHRRLVNALRGLRRKAQEPDELPAEGDDGPGTFNELSEARRRYGVG